MMSREPLDKVLLRSHAAIVADLTSTESRTDGFFRILTLRATPIEILFGETVTPGDLLCQYRQGLIHRRGDLVDYPLITGSGIEFGVKPGDRVILLIAPDGASQGSCRVLRMETLEERESIRRFGATRSGP